MRTSFLLAIVFLLSAVGCAPAAEPLGPQEPAEPQVDLAAERESLMQADRDWYEAYSSSDTGPDAFVERVLDDARLLPPDAPLAQGKEAIRTSIVDLEAMPGFAISWSPTAADVGSGGDLGYTTGTYEMEYEGPQAATFVINGKYLTVWKKQADGTWMVTADMFNADGAPTPVQQ